MKPLNKQFAPKSVMPEKVIQFGEGNFLGTVGPGPFVPHIKTTTART